MPAYSVTEYRLAFKRAWGLATRELDLMELLLLGNTNRDIAKLRKQSVDTVAMVKRRIFKKTGATSVRKLLSEVAFLDMHSLLKESGREKQLFLPPLVDEPLVNTIYRLVLASVERSCVHQSALASLVNWDQRKPPLERDIAIYICNVKIGIYGIMLKDALGMKHDNSINKVSGKVKILLKSDPRLRELIDRCVTDLSKVLQGV